MSLPPRGYDAGRLHVKDRALWAGRLWKEFGIGAPGRVIFENLRFRAEASRAGVERTRRRDPLRRWLQRRPPPPDVRIREEPSLNTPLTRYPAATMEQRRGGQGSGAPTVSNRALPWILRKTAPKTCFPKPAFRPRAGPASGFPGTLVRLSNFSETAALLRRSSPPARCISVSAHNGL